MNFRCVGLGEGGYISGEVGAEFGWGEDFDVPTAGEDAALHVDQIIEQQGYFDRTVGMRFDVLRGMPRALPNIGSGYGVELETDFDFLIAGKSADTAEEMADDFFS